jgi:hypothetical protein
MRIISKVVVVLMGIVFFSCEDIIEEDITNDTIQVIYPQNSEVVTSNVVNFQWQSLDGADDYRVQVFTSNTSNMVLDSLVPQNHLNIPMPQGNYQWRVRGENSAYTSTYSMNHNFSVVESTDLTNQLVILSSPSDSFYTNNSNAILSWQSLTAAQSYSFELVNITNSQSIVNQQSNLTATSLALNNTLLSVDSEYRWKVKAVNTTSQSQFTSRRIFLDRVIPNQPLNVLPIDNSTQIINQQINFTWSIPADTGTIQSAITYEIEFSHTISFGAIFQTSTATGSSFQQPFTALGDYYWRVKAKDAAGNVSVVSSPFKFTIN